MRIDPREPRALTLALHRRGDANQAKAAKRLSEEDQARFDVLMREARGLLREATKLDQAKENRGFP